MAQTKRKAKPKLVRSVQLTTLRATDRELMARLVAQAEIEDRKPVQLLRRILKMALPA